jgi:hypothetical protein
MTSLILALLQGLLGSSGPEAYFEFQDVHNDRFVIKLVEEKKIAHARAILAGRSVERLSISGRIVKKPAPYNPGWSYHLKPRSIAFFDFAIEVCDASIGFVEDHRKAVGGSFLPGGRWCPWTSRLTREVTLEVYLNALVNDLHWDRAMAWIYFSRFIDGASAPWAESRGR